MRQDALESALGIACLILVVAAGAVLFRYSPLWAIEAVAVVGIAWFAVGDVRAWEQSGHSLPFRAHLKS